MSRERWMLYAALAIACAGLALSVRATLREPAARPAGPGAFVDHEARAELDKLRRALAQRDAMIDRMRAAAGAPGSHVAAGDPLPPPSGPAAPDPGPVRFVRFEVENPAVTVTQKDDGSYDIRTSDPALSGQVLTMTGVTSTGEERSFSVRVP